MVYEVGKFYMVPCLQASLWPPGFARRGDWIPVLLPEHDDKEVIGFPTPHYHLDFRFLSEWQRKRANHGSILHQRLSGSLELYVGGVAYRRKKCRREMPDWYEWAAARKWMPALQDRYKDAQMVNGKCPHKGIDLSGCPARYGRVVCPGHGLVWDAATGKNVDYRSIRWYSKMIDCRVTVVNGDLGQPLVKSRAAPVSSK